MTACVATEYGETLLPQGEELTRLRAASAARGDGGALPPASASIWSSTPRIPYASVDHREHRRDLRRYGHGVSPAPAARHGCAGKRRLCRGRRRSGGVSRPRGREHPAYDRQPGAARLCVRPRFRFACLRPRAADGGFAPRLPRGGTAAGAHPRDAGAVFQRTQRRHAPEHRRGVSRNEGLRQRRRI